MATVTVARDELRIRFAVWERALLWRAGMTVPLGAVREVESVEHPLPRTRGGRAGLLARLVPAGAGRAQ